MTITFVTDKTKELLKQGSQQEVVPAVVREAIDVYVEAKKELDAMALERKPLETKMAKDAGKIQAYVAEKNVPADEPVNLAGDNHTVQISARSSAVTSVDATKVLEFLGTDVFLKLAKLGIGDLRKYLTPEQFSEVAEEGRTGSRRIKIID